MVPGELEGLAARSGNQFEFYLMPDTEIQTFNAADRALDVADFGHVHLTSEIAWVLEVPRDRVDALHASGMAMQYIDRSRGPSPASGLAEADVEDAPVVRLLRSLFEDAIQVGASDIHIEPYPGGPTSVNNSCCLCRRHRRLKTHAARWRVVASPDGSLTWARPTGETSRTLPQDFRSVDGQDVPPF